MIVKTFESAHRTVLGVHGAVGKAHDVVFRCTVDVSQADRWLEVPAWTFDRTACPDAKLLTAQPFASIDALAALLDLALKYRTSSAVVQSAVAEVLSAIYEVDFHGFSYGFSRRGVLTWALDALHTAIMSQHVNWVLDADIRSFHEWLLRMVARRIADPRIILRLIEQWLQAGVLESGEKQDTDTDTPQPLLANIFLHTTSSISGSTNGVVAMHAVADDFVMGFESKTDAQEMLLALKARLASFGLMLHEDKTRLIEFGWFAVLSPRRHP